MKLTPARKAALTAGIDGITATSKVIDGFRQDVLDALENAGWLKWRPYGKPPSWRITPAGRAALAQH